jgi:hypothetical protein
VTRPCGFWKVSSLRTRIADNSVFGLHGLPHLFSVILGDMNLAGPSSRAVSSRHRLQHSMPPISRLGLISESGITGEITSATYGAEWSFRGDLKILAQTLARQAASSETSLLKSRPSRASLSHVHHDR